MTLLLNRLFPIILMFCVWATSAVSQTTPDGAKQANEIGQAREALIQILEDPDSRAALIKQLTAEQDAGGNEQSPPPETETEVNVSRSAKDGIVLTIGEYTRAIADQAGVLLNQAGRSINGLGLIATGQIPVKWDRVQTVLTQVIFVLFAAYVVYAAAQVLARKSYKRLAVKARYGGGIARTSILLFTTLIDTTTVALGLGGGYLCALVAYGGLEAGVTIQESLALNAFFVTGMANVALRFVFAPNRPELRLLPFDDTSSNYWYGRLRLYMYWTNYGIFLAVPVANIAVSFVLGNALRFLVVLSGMLYLMALVIRNRTTVRQGAYRYSETLHSVLAQRAIANLGKVWHLAALGYIIAIFIIWVSRPFDATTIILRATGLSVVTVMAGMALSLIMTRAIRGGIRLPDNWNQALPALQYRLNAFVPRILKLVRSAVFLGTVLMLLDIWGVFRVRAWFESETGARLLSSTGSALLVLLVGFAVWLALMSWVDLRLQSRSGRIVTARERTLFQLFRNAATVVILVMSSLLALSELGIDIGPLIAGAGVVGLAISFGAQTLVKDIITGAFIQIENAINEGDVVTVAGITGTVEGITVRSVRIRDLNGTSHIIPFSSVDMVSNFMRGFSYHVAIIGVAYDTDVAVAKDAMLEAFRRLRETDYGAKILSDMEMNGVINFGPSSIDIRARIKTLPGDQWSVGRAYNEYVKQVFDERNIEIPFPQVTYHAATPPFVRDDGEKTAKPKLPKKPKAISGDAPPGEGVE
ncbi:mechanosensitive ion channel domain-containing protein [Labrenzia sp. PHM005]|uniref:mechanosensitive ion channel domain-containing protein n=1 Tax=Labrenzia sp. PHM005 TaxID=2590016 RepID=UPI001AD8D7B5|nr:mechanosensitive ion channel domain-containing protein [Labrenzia sp. PHM005]